MDGSAAIERNRAALKRIARSLMAMAGLDVAPDPQTRADPEPAEAEHAQGAPRTAAVPSTSPLWGGRRSPDRRVGVVAGSHPSPGASHRPSHKAQARPERPTLPRHLWRAILRLLRPAEAAARRLIIAAARGIVVSLPPPREPKPKPVPPEQFLRSLGLAVRMTPAEIARAAAAARRAAAAARRVSAPARPRRLSLPLLDPLRHPARKAARHVPAHALPRIMLPGVIEPFSLPRPPSADDAVSAARLCQRLAALVAALDDLPGEALRFARWKARRDLGLTRRLSPLRPGRPPGGRLTRFDPAAHDAAGTQGKRASRKIREVDEILAHAHSLALYALDNPDTS